MADSVQTIRDLVSGFNTMAMSVGLTPMSGQQQGMPMPLSPAMGMAPPPPPPQVKPPAQAAQEAMQQMDTQVRQATTQRQTQSWHAGEFADRMKTIQAAYIPITQADAYARIMQQPGMGVPGIGPMPIMTDPSMGVFRQQQRAPAPFVTPPMMPTLPAPSFAGIPGIGGTMQSAMGGLLAPFAGAPPASQFTDPYERQIMLQQFRNQQQFARAMSSIPEYAGGAATALGTMGGAMAGGRLMARGGRLGLLTGAAGAIAGGIGGYMAGQQWLSPAAEAGAQAAVTDPAMRTRAYGAQLQDLSAGFVVQGGQLGPTGRGLSQRASIQLANRLQGMVEEGQMGNFNMRDVMRVAGGAANQGMLDMAQNSEQIASQVRNVAKGLQNFMRIAQEPDVQRAMQMMAGMRQMGLTVPESGMAMQNARQFARMAGTNAQAMMAGPGMQGAATYQRVGLTAGLGLQAGMAAGGFAQQAIAGGAFTPAQLALAGGPQGLTQTLTEASAASVSGQNRFQLLATLSRASSGELMVDPERLKSVMSGHISVSQQAAMAAENVSRLAMGGRSPTQVLTEFASRRNELRDELGRRMGPMGGMLMTLRNAMNVQRELGGAIDLGQAIRMAAPGMSDNQVRTMQVMAESPGFWRGAQQQILADVPRQRAAEAARRQAVIEDQTGWFGRSWAGRAGRAVSGAVEGLGQEWREGIGRMSEWWSDVRGAVERDATGARVVRTPSQFQIQDPATRRAIEQGMMSESAARDQARYAGAFGVQAARPSADPTTWQNISAGYGLVRQAGIIAGSVLGKGIGGAAISAFAPEAEAAGQADINRALQITGGWGGQMGGGAMGYASSAAGWIAENMGWANVVGMAGDHMRPLRQYAIARAQGVLQSGQQLREGVALGTTGTREMRQTLQQSYAAIARGEGDDSDMGDMEDLAVEAVIDAVAETNRKGFGGQKMTSGELKEAARKRLLASGKNKAVVDQMLDATWSTGLGQIVMTRARNEGGKNVKAQLTQVMDNEGFNLSGRDLKEVMKKAKDFSKQTRQIIGGTERSIWTGAVVNRLSEEQATAYERFAAKVDPEEMLVRQAMALRDKAADASDEDAARLRDQANELLKGVRGRVGEDKFRGMMKLVTESRVEDEDLKEAIEIAAERSAGRFADDQIKVAKTVQKRSQAVRREVAIRKGAARVAEEEGVTISEVMRRADVSTEEGRAFRLKLFRSGDVEGEAMGLGGRGRGGEAEAAARSQAGQLADFAAQIPKFREATQKLNEAADNLNRSVRAGAVIRTKPGG